MQEIKCPNCGAMIDPHDPKCPYCEYINPTGAQEKFMRELEEKREKLDNVDEEAAELYNTEIKKKGKRLAITIAVTAAVILLGILAYSLKDRFFRNSYERTAEEQIREIAWQKEHFPKLDELYEAEKYDELVDLYFKYLEDGNHDLWDWEHYSFLDCLGRFSLFTESLRTYPRCIQEGNPSLVSSVVYQAVRFYYRDYANDKRLSERDLAYLDSLSEYAASVVHDKFHFSDDDMEDLRTELCGKGYVEFAACEKITKEYFEQFTE